MQLTVLQCRLLSYHSYYTLTGKLLFIPKEYFLLSFKHLKSGTLSIYTLYYSYVVKNLYEKKNSNDGSISNRFMQGSVYFFPSPLFSSHAELQNYIHHSTADIAYSTSDLFAATVHYTESTCVSNLIVLAVHTLELNLIYCMFQAVLHSYRSIPQYCIQY